MELVFIHGPPAVGKLTVARELSALTGLPLFHNHYVVDAVMAVFDFGSESARKLREGLWLAVFDEAARVDRSLIFTFAPERTISAAFIGDTVRTVESHGGAVRFVALTCAAHEQARRVEAPSRRAYSKLQSADVLRQLTADGAMDFAPIPAERVIDTGRASPQEAARQIATLLGR